MKLDLLWTIIHPVDTSRLDLDLLQALEVLLAERNVTRAAARLGLSQPALSAQLARLRTMFGDALLVPGRRGMAPTAKALELQEPLRAALDQVRAVVTARRSFDPTKARMTVHVAASDYVQSAVLLDLALALRRDAPGLRLAIRALDVPALVSAMERGDVDVAVLTTDLVPPSLRRRPLFDERYVAVARKDHPIVRGRLGLDRFAKLEHVMVSPLGGGFRSPVDGALAALGRKRDVVLSAASFLFVLEAIERSDMVALVPSRLVRDRGDRLRTFEPPLPVPGFSIVMAWHDRNHDHAGHRWVRQALADVVSARRGVEAPRREG